ncbi:hypothetical protein [Campylobacter concisus]|uniref:gp53-like domain-containing protein n=1 Tax=Campylobacter concisus TaxID=199 RepID=UPI00122C4CD8|nr:hypothetical protein [Campylobacter concisus]
MIYEKPKNEIFASDAKDGEIVEFPNVKRGWGVTENLGFIPPMEYFNAAFNRVDKSLAYQLQRGVGEWDKDLEYPIGAVVSLSGIIYVAKSQSTNKNPSENKGIWHVIASEEWCKQTCLSKGDYGLGGLDNMPVLQNIDDTTTPTGFYRAVENQTSGTFPQPYGGSRHAHVLVERVDVNWIKQTIVQISQDGTKPIFYRTNNLNRGWHPWKEVVTADGYNLDILKNATSNSSSNTLVRRDENGDFEGRWIMAGHFLMRTKAQDSIFDENSEICFRMQQTSEDSPSHMRFASLAKFKEALGLSRGSVGASGWVGLPMGLILQWGQIQQLGVGEEREIMFPIVFPNRALSVVAAPGLPSPNDAISSLHVNGFFKEKFAIQNTDANSTYPAYWIAIGH